MWNGIYFFKKGENIITDFPIPMTLNVSLNFFYRPVIILGIAVIIIVIFLINKKIIFIKRLIETSYYPNPVIELIEPLMMARIPRVKTNKSILLLLANFSKLSIRTKLTSVATKMEMPRVS